jgi:hypothetical protein
MEDGLVNMNAGSEAAMVGGGLVDCGDVREMEVAGPPEPSCGRRL